MLVTVLLIVCALSDGGCVTVKPEQPEDLTPLSCPIMAMVTGAQWIERNQGYRLERALCVYGFKNRDA